MSIPTTLVRIDSDLVTEIEKVAGVNKVPVSRMASMLLRQALKIKNAHRAAPAKKGGKK